MDSGYWGIMDDGYWEVVEDGMDRLMVFGEFMEEQLCIMEQSSFQRLLDEQSDYLDQLREQKPWNWKWRDFDDRNHAISVTDPSAFRGKQGGTLCVQIGLRLRKFTEQQLLFGGIEFDPLLTSFALFPLAGALAIALSEICTAPLSRITILSQLGQLQEEEDPESSILRQAARIIEQEGGGYQALWRGGTVAVAHRLAFYGVNLLAYSAFRALLLTSNVPMKPFSVALVSGGLAAFTAASVSYPLDTLTTRNMALQTSETNKSHEGDLGSLYAGLSASLLSVVPSMAISFTVYEGLYFGLCKLRPNGSLLLTAFVAGSVAGLAASAATFPISLVQKRMQSAAKEQRGRGGGVWQMFRQMVKEEGVRGLYKGIQPHCLKTVLGHATAFITYETVKVPLYIAQRKYPYI